MNLKALVLSLSLLAPALAHAGLPPSCYQSCSAQCLNELQQLESQILNFRTYGCGQIPTPPPAPIVSVELYQNDRCDRDLVGIVNPTTFCDGLSGSKRVWAIRVNGVCYDIKDTTELAACKLFKEAGTPGSTWIYGNDRCDRDLVGVVNFATACAELHALRPDNAWAIRLGGVQAGCSDINDMSFQDACLRFGGK